MCNCECEWSAVFEEKMVVARKKHICCECGSDIDPGEIYQSVSGLWDGEWSRYKTCSVCVKVRCTARAEVDCCIPYGELYEVVGSDFEEAGV